MTPSDQRERVALALLNEHRADWGFMPCESVDECEDPESYRRLADAAINALASDEEQQ